MRGILFGVVRIRFLYILMGLSSSDCALSTHLSYHHKSVGNRANHYWQTNERTARRNSRNVAMLPDFLCSNSRESVYRCAKSALQGSLKRHPPPFSGCLNLCPPSPRAVQSPPHPTWSKKCPISCPRYPVFRLPKCWW